MRGEVGGGKPDASKTDWTFNAAATASAPFALAPALA
jgi:hypothetical protein